MSQPATNSPRSFTIAFKFAASISLLVIAGMVILALITVRNQSTLNQKILDEFGQTIANQIASSAIEPVFTDNEFELKVLLRNMIENQRIAGIQIVNREGLILASSGRDIPAITDNKVRIQSLSDGDTILFVYTSPVAFRSVVGGYVHVAFIQQPMAMQLQESLTSMLWVTLLLCSSISLLGIAMGKRLSQPITDLAIATAHLRDGKITTITDRRHDEVGQLIDAINSMSHGLLQKEQVEHLLSKLVDPDVAEKVISQMEEVELGGEQVYATVLFADIVGFTSISEELSPSDVRDLLNEYYGYFDACAKFYFGTTDKFIGDCVMLVFGAPKADKEHQYHAIACAVLMNRLVKRLNDIRLEKGLYEVNLRIGINTGNMLAGLIGGQNRMEYTVVGDAVNLASRLCNEADGYQIIIEEGLFDDVSAYRDIKVEERKQIKIRGKAEPVNIYDVVDIDSTQIRAMDDFIKDIVGGKHA